MEHMKQKIQTLLTQLNHGLVERNATLKTALLTVLALFGSAGEIREFSMVGQNNSAGLLKFLQQGFGGGTNFETPLKHAFEMSASKKDYKKADVLMISDGDCSLSPEFTKTLKTQKEILNCMVYSVLCADSRVQDTFSDEVVVL